MACHGVLLACPAGMFVTYSVVKDLGTSRLDGNQIRDVYDTPVSFQARFESTAYHEVVFRY